MNRRRLLLAGGAVLVGGVRVRAGSELVVGADPSFDEWNPAPGSWPSVRYGSRNTAANPHASPPRNDPSVAWETTVRSGALDVVVDDGAVYVRGSQRVVALDANTGDERWRIPSRGHGPVRSAVADGRLYLGEPGGVRAFDSRDGWDALRNDGPATAWTVSEQPFGHSPSSSSGGC